MTALTNLSLLAAAAGALASVGTSGGHRLAKNMEPYEPMQPTDGDPNSRAARRRAAREGRYARVSPHNRQIVRVRED
jgi:hypothetical protein